MPHDLYNVSLKAILLNRSGQMLALRALQRGTFGGFYDLPGGRIHENEFTEPIPDILKREVREEIGPVHIEVARVPVAIGRHELQPRSTNKRAPRRILYLFFLARFIRGAIHVSHEHESFQWIPVTRTTVRRLFISGLREGLEMYLNSGPRARKTNSMSQQR